MTIERKKGDVVFRCDECDSIFTIDNKDFPATWTAAKAEGWESIREGVGKAAIWTHACPSCAE